MAILSRRKTESRMFVFTSGTSTSWEENAIIKTRLGKNQKRSSPSLILKNAVKHSISFTRAVASFKFSDLEVRHQELSKLQPKPDASKLLFGKYFTDHMFEVDWDAKKGWGKPVISPLHNLSLHPGAKVLHYAVELFEGMKAFRGVDDKIRLFRPECNMERMIKTADRSSLPAFDANELIECIKRLVAMDREWVPHSEASSLYIRPTLIGTEPALGVVSPSSALLYVVLCPVGPYFASGLKPVSLLADPKYVRAWPGGCGAMKMGSNYAPTIRIQKIAEESGHQQVLWLYGDDHQLTEAGTMNIFVYLENKKGERELITPPLNGLILPGVTRRSLLELAREWGEFKVSERNITMKEVSEALSEGRLLEMFGAGTACVVCPVSSITYEGKRLNIPTMEHATPLNVRFLKAINDIQYGRVEHPWGVLVDNKMTGQQTQVPQKCPPQQNQACEPVKQQDCEPPKQVCPPAKQVDCPPAKQQEECKDAGKGQAKKH